MPERFKRICETNKMRHLKTRSPVCIQEGTPLKTVLKEMKAHKRGCVIVLKKNKMTGVFTERDLLRRVIGGELSLATPIEAVMSKNPSWLTPDSPVAEAVRIMSQKGYRHIPLLDDKQHIQGFVSVRDILDHFAEHFPHEVYNLPPNPNQRSRRPEGA